MPTNDFLAFATAGGANVINQAAYAVLGARTAGFAAGLAESVQLNKVWRQAAFSSAVLMQYITETLNSDSLDNGDVAAHVIRLRNALSAGATNPAGLAAVRAGRCFNNAVAPNTKVDLNADVLLMNDATGKVTRVVPAGAVTCDTGLAGPAINGRDQAPAFGNSQHIYFYFIRKPSTGTLASISSLTPPAAFDGSTLPALYTEWAFSHPVYKDGAGNLYRHHLLGDIVYLDTYVQVLNNGVATVETPVSVAAVVPPDALSYQLQVEATHKVTNITETSAIIRALSGFDFALILPGILPNTAVNGMNANSPVLDMPNVGQQFHYLWQAAATGRELDAVVQSYRVANGG